MELRNQTPYTAGFFNCVVSRDELLGAVIARATFRMEKGSLVLDHQNPFPVGSEPLKLPEGELDREVPFLRKGVDLMILGHAYAPNGKPVESLSMTIKVGEKFLRRILVIGDRVWEGDINHLKPSRPKPFLKIPLSYQRAYGGKSLGEAGLMAFPANGEGRGFYLTAEQALGNPLPNLEDPENPIQSWKDQPNPVGTGPYPASGSLRLMNSIELTKDPTKEQIKHPSDIKIKRIKPEFFNNAHPSMIIYEPIQTGDVVEVSHLTPEGPFRFNLPDLSMHAHVQLENRHFLFPSHLESIVILGDERRVFFTSRIAFRYRIIPLERRVVTLYQGPPPSILPDHYVIQWEH